MKKRLAAFAALFVLVILAACAGAQETITFGGGSGYLGFVGDDGRLSDIKGISLALQLEAPLDEDARVRVRPLHRPGESRKLVLADPWKEATS